MKSVDQSDLMTQSGSDGNTRVYYIGDVAVIRMNRGENRMNLRFVDEINDALDNILKNESITTVITTGEGKFYSNGIDLNWVGGLLQGGKMEVVALFVQKWLELQVRFLQLPLITVAAMNGHAMAGGAVFSLCHDYRIMNDSRGWWSLNEVHLNLRFDPLLIAIGRSRLSPEAMREGFIFGKRYTAQQAIQQQIIDRAVPSSELIRAAQNIALEVVPKGTRALSRESLGNMKEDVYRGVRELLVNRKQDDRSSLFKYSKL